MMSLFPEYNLNVTFVCFFFSIYRVKTGMFYNYSIKIGRKKVSLYTYRASKVTLLSTSPKLILNFKSRLHVLLNRAFSKVGKSTPIRRNADQVCQIDS